MQIPAEQPNLSEERHSYCPLSGRICKQPCPSRRNIMNSIADDPEGANWVVASYTTGTLRERVNAIGSALSRVAANNNGNPSQVCDNLKPN